MSIINQLTLFVDVVQQGSFAKAAALHDMDNSSLSKQIKKGTKHPIIMEVKIHNKIGI
ncbi:LysR family transcriptional regulator [Pseudoalteromonas sp. SR44-2]|uniref:helix-turn-helix domain-containing protein n=1 Tax=Pseudoalteromonas sp. SR44-2 TaxID=2760937 RepID=UPI0021760ECB|nr:LysR family transcriptional regulator [Pseudoalteromonas sp. SR44-2]